MRNMRKSWTLAGLAAVVPLCLVLAACGSKDQDAGNSTGSNIPADTMTNAEKGASAPAGTSGASGSAMGGASGSATADGSGSAADATTMGPGTIAGGAVSPSTIEPSTTDAINTPAAPGGSAPGAGSSNTPGEQTR